MKNLYLDSATYDLVVGNDYNLRFTEDLTEYVSQKIENVRPDCISHRDVRLAAEGRHYRRGELWQGRADRHDREAHERFAYAQLLAHGQRSIHHPVSA